MSTNLPQNIKISARLERVLDELEDTTNFKGETIKIPAHGGEDGRKEKEFPRVLGRA